jgi:hypothetical protein
MKLNDYDATWRSVRRISQKPCIEMTVMALEVNRKK